MQSPPDGDPAPGKAPPAARYDVVIAGGGHNGLVAAAYLARAGRSVLLLERLDEVGGAAVSVRTFAGVDARLSRYAYLVSLLPQAIVKDLGLQLELRRRSISSYTPVVRDGEPTGLLIDAGYSARTQEQMTELTGDPKAFAAWEEFYAAMSHMARRVFPTLIEPLRSGADLRRRVDDDEIWEALFERPLSAAIEHAFTDDTVRGIVATDGLIGTFAALDDPSLLQNRCFLYHVIGNGAGDWDVPVGGMGAVIAALADAARGAGAEIRTGAEVVAIDPGDQAGGAEVSFRSGDTAYRVAAGVVLANVAPAVLAGLLGEPAEDPAPEGAQLKVNLLLSRLPRLRDASVDPLEAFAGTFHVNEGYAELAAAHAQATAGAIPDVPPCEIYCHSLTDPSILGPELSATGAHTLTLFGLHMPARLFRADHDGARAAALAATLRSLDTVLAEPVEDCLLLDGDGAPCVEAKTPLDLEVALGLPGGNIFHRDLSWPFAERAEEVGTWGVETHHPTVLLCGAGARRGGGVSGIPGHNAAMAVLGHRR